MNKESKLKLTGWKKEYDLIVVNMNQFVAEEYSPYNYDKLMYHLAVRECFKLDEQAFYEANRIILKLMKGAK